MALSPTSRVQKALDTYRPRPMSAKNRRYFIASRRRLIALYLKNGMDPTYIAKLRAQLAALLEG